MVVPEIQFAVFGGDSRGSWSRSKSRDAWNPFSQGVKFFTAPGRGLFALACLPTFPEDRQLSQRESAYCNLTRTGFK